MADGVQRPGGGPRRFEDVYADLSRPEVHVRVEDARGEADPGRGERVRVRDEDRELKLGALVRGALWTPDEGGPGPEVRLVGEGQLDAVVGVFLLCVVQAAGRGCAGVFFVFLFFFFF